jgi:hypothetical protein
MKIDNGNRARKFRKTAVSVLGTAIVVSIIFVILPHRFGWQDLEIMSTAVGIGALVYLGTLFFGKRLKGGS